MSKNWKWIFGERPQCQNLCVGRGFVEPNLGYMMAMHFKNCRKCQAKKAILQKEIRFNEKTRLSQETQER